MELLVEIVRAGNHLGIPNKNIGTDSTKILAKKTFKE
jgi:hypothetical protein